MFNLTEAPSRFPGKTLLGDTRGPVVDTGVDWNGIVYLNEIEAGEIARLFGWISPQVNRDMIEEFNRVAAELENALVTIEALKAQQAQVINLDTARTLLLERSKSASKPKATA